MPHFRSNMQEFGDRIAAECLPGSSRLISVFSTDDSEINGEHRQFLKEIIKDKNRSEEDEAPAIELLREIYFERYC